MIERRSWEEFRNAGLLWWINRTLHLFGWAIVMEVESDGKITAIYPARVNFRGFDSLGESEGFEQLTAHLGDNIGHLLKDVDNG